MFGIVLSGLGAMAYAMPDLLGVGKDGAPPTVGSPTSLSPAGIGALLILAGAVSLAAPGARKHAMHLAAVGGLLGTIGGLVPVILRNFQFAETAVKVGLLMSLLSLCFLALCIKSFVDARKARQAAETPVP
jgi:hypothetical protein